MSTDISLNQIYEIEGRSYRIVNITGNSLRLFPMNMKTLDLKEYTFEQLKENLSKEVAKLSEDPYEALRMSSPSEKIMKRADERYDQIKGLLSNPDIYNSATRSHVFRTVTNGDKKLYVKLYRLLHTFWLKGCSKTALIPESGKSSGNHKCGRKAQCERTKNFETHLEHICTKYLLKTPSLSLEKAYIHSLSEWEEKYPGVPAPTRSQLRYYFDTHYSKKDKAEKRNDSVHYDKDIRSLRGKASDTTEGPGETYEIDSTPDNVYLVSSKDRNQVIGRPVLYVVTDVYSGMIVGLNVSLESSCFMTAADSLYSAFTSKPEYCKKFGVTIKEEDWPCSGIPSSIVCDNAELVGYQSDMLVQNLGITLHNTGSFRGDQKGTVERLIGLIQSSLAEWQISRPCKTRIKKEGAKDTRDKAFLTLKEYTAIALTMVPICNARIKESGPAEYPQKLAYTPLQIWKWGLSTGRGGLMQNVSNSTVRILLLPRYEASFSRDGILAAKAPITSLRYWNEELEKKGTFIREETPYRPKNAWLALDPADISCAYLFLDPSNPARYSVCELASQCDEYKGLTMLEAKNLSETRKTVTRKAQESYDHMRKEGLEEVKKMVTSALDNKPSDNADAKRKIKNIVQARKDELTELQKSNKRVVGDELKVADTDGSSGIAISKNQNELNDRAPEPDYHYPSSIKDILD